MTVKLDYDNQLDLQKRLFLKTRWGTEWEELQGPCDISKYSFHLNLNIKKMFDNTFTLKIKKNESSRFYIVIFFLEG